MIAKVGFPVRIYASALLLLIVNAVVYAQDTPAGRVVTIEDWEAQLPVLGVIVIFTLAVTGVFFYYAIRNLRRTTSDQ